MLLPPDIEETFARCCYAAVWYEEVFRSGRVFPGTPLGSAGARTTLADLLVAVPEYAVADLLALQALAGEGLADLRAATNAQQVNAGPVFAGSVDVGGADADLIAAGLLLDIKATADPAKVTTQDAIWQLAGYALLDYTDEYKIDSVGWYLARLGHLVTWPVAEYLALLGARRSLPELRARLAQLVPR